MATRNKKKNNDEKLLNFFSDMMKKSKNVMSMQGAADAFAPKHYITTGLLNLDMMLCFDENAPWARNGDGQRYYGLPTGRIVEFAGQSGSFKTYLGHYLCAEVVRQGGLSFYMSSEFDFDQSFVEMFYEDKTLTMMQTPSEKTFEDVDGVQHFFGAGLTFERVEEVLGDYMRGVEKLRDKGFDGPVCIFLDSLAALRTKAENETAFKNEKDNKGPAYGKGASSKHRFLSLMMERCAELDILFVYINHLRDAMNGANPAFHNRWMPASNKTVEFYPSVRFKFMKGGSENATQEGKKFKFGQEIRVIMIKKRGYPVQDNEQRITHFSTENHYGFDEVDTTLKGLHISGILHNNSGGFQFRLRDGHETESQLYVSDYLERHPISRLPEKKMKQYLSESVEVDNGLFLLHAIELAKEYGPEMYRNRESLDVVSTIINQDDYIEDDGEEL